MSPHLEVNSSFFTAAIFFGSGLSPLALHWCPKKETCGRLNCILSWIQGQCIFPADFQKVDQMFVMFQVAPPIDDHVICYACDSWNAKENCIQFPLKDVLCHNGTHWKSSPLKPSNVQGHCCVFSLNSGSNSTIQYPLLKSVIVNLVIPWNFPMISSMEHV